MSLLTLDYKNLATSLFENVLIEAPALGKKYPMAQNPDARAKESERMGIEHIGFGIYANKGNHDKPPHYRWNDHSKHFEPIAANDPELKRALKSPTHQMKQPLGVRLGRAQPVVDSEAVKHSFIADLERFTSTTDLNAKRQIAKHMIKAYGLQLSKDGNLRSTSALGRQFWGNSGHVPLHQALNLTTKKGFFRQPAKDFVHKVQSLGPNMFPIEGEDAESDVKLRYNPANVHKPNYTDSGGDPRAEVFKGKNGLKKITIKIGETEHVLEMVDGVHEDNENYKQSDYYQTLQYRLNNMNRTLPKNHKMSVRDIESQAEILYQSAQVYNYNISKLYDMFRADGTIKGKIYEGGEASSVSAVRDLKAMISLEKELSLPASSKEEILRMLDELNTIDPTGLSYDKKFSDVTAKLTKSIDMIESFRVHLPRICENLSIIEACHKGQMVVIPNDPNYAVGDFIGIDKNLSKRTWSSARPTKVEIDDNSLSKLIPGSVKKNIGTAAGSRGKINLSIFKGYTNHKGQDISGMEIKEDLDFIVGEGPHKLFTQIFHSEDSTYAEKSLDSLFDKYGDLVYDYCVGANEPSWESMTGSQQKIVLKGIRECFSRGRLPTDGACKADYPLHLQKGQCGHSNMDRWKLYGQAGRLLEALHNKTIARQGYITHQYKVGEKLVICNGGHDSRDNTKTYSGMEFQMRTTLRTGKNGCMPNGSFQTLTKSLRR